jgi:hypothetical protein
MTKLLVLGLFSGLFYHENNLSSAFAAALKTGSKVLFPVMSS